MQLNWSGPDREVSSDLYPNTALSRALWEPLSFPCQSSASPLTQGLLTSSTRK